MTNQKHNGWTNYATWRINLEIFDGYDTDGMEVDHGGLQEVAEELILMDVDETSMVASYAMAFMSNVNWHEIAEHLNEDMEVEND